MAFDHLIKKGCTGQIIELTLRDAFTGQGVSGIAPGSVTFSYCRRGAAVSTVVACQAMTKGTWASSGWVEMDAVNRPGEYQFGLPDAALAAGADGVTLRFKVAGAIDKEVKIVLIAADLQAANIPANVIQWNATAVSLSGGYPAVTAANMSSTAISGIWAISTASLATAGSIGKLLVDNLDARISSGLTAAQVWSYATRSLSDKSGFVLDPYQSFNNSGQVQALPANVKFWQDHIPATNINDAENAAYPRVIAADIESSGTSSIWTYPNRSLTDKAGFSLANGSISSSTFAAGAINATVAPNLDTAISSRMATFTPLAAADVWNYATRALTDKSADVVAWKGQAVADPVLGSGALPMVYMSSFDASAGQSLANTVWRTATATITTAGSFADLLKTNLDAQVSLIPAGVWSTGGRTLSDWSSFGLSATDLQNIAQWVWSQNPASIGTGFGQLLKTSLDAPVSSRLAEASYVAPDNAGIAAIQNQTDRIVFVDHGDGTWDVRVPAGGGGLTAEEVWTYATRSLTEGSATVDNAAIAAAVWANSTRSLTEAVDIRSNSDITLILGRVDVPISTRLAASDYLAPDNAALGALAGDLASLSALVSANLDVPVSSRMASFVYLAPDNAGIAAIQTQTDQLSFSDGKLLATLNGEVVNAGVDTASIAAAVWSNASRTITGGSLDTVVNPITTTDTAAIAAIQAATDKLAFVSHGDGTWDVRVSAADVWAYADRSLTDKAGFALANGSISSATFALGAINSGVAPNLDAAISSRMASFVYVAPDNAGIAAIRAQADKMFFLPHGDGTFDLRSTATIDHAAIADAVWASATRSLTTPTADWTDMERGQIRHALGISGPRASTNGEGLLDDVHFQAMKLQFNSESDVLASLAGESVLLNPMQNFNNIGQTDELPAKDSTLRGLLTAERVGRLEYLDTPVSTRSSHTPTDVWSFNDRTLTSFGSLVSDMAAAVWTFGARTLTGFGSLVSDVWSFVSRTITAGTVDLSAQAKADVRLAADAALADYAPLTYSDAAFDRDRIIDQVESVLAAVNLKPTADAIALAVDVLLSANHGEGSWIDTSKGSGPITYTVSVTDAANPIAFASVRLSVGPLGISQTTDAQGKAVFDVQPGTYKVQVAKLGYTGYSTTVMLGETPAEQGFTATIAPLAVITFPPEPDQCTAYLTTYDAIGHVQSGVEIELRLVSPPAGSSAESFSAKPWTITSDAQGQVQATLLKNAAYQVRRGAGEWHLLRTDNRDAIPMPTVLSHPSR